MRRLVPTRKDKAKQRQQKGKNISYLSAQSDNEEEQYLPHGRPKHQPAAIVRKRRVI